MLLLVITVTGFSTATAAEDDDSGLAALVEVLADTDDAAFQLDLLKGMGEGLKGRKQVTMPQAWPKVYGKLARSKNAEVRRRATELDDVDDEKVGRVLREAHLTAEQAEQIYELTALSTVYQR